MPTTLTHAAPGGGSVTTVNAPLKITHALAVSPPRFALRSGRGPVNRSYNRLVVRAGGWSSVTGGNTAVCSKVVGG